MKKGMVLLLYQGERKALKDGRMMDWMTEAVKSYKELLNIGMEVFGNKDKAIEYANENSCRRKRKQSRKLPWQDF